MSEFNFKYSRKEESMQIDFGKLKSGLTKDDLSIEEGSLLASIFNIIDKNSGGSLDRQELSIFKNVIAELAGNDLELSFSEAKKFELTEDFSKKEVGNLLFEFLGKLSETTKGIKSVKNLETDNSEIIEYENGLKEQKFADGTKIVTEKKGDIVVNTKYTKEDTIISEEQILADGTKIVAIDNENNVKTTSFDNNDNKKEIIFDKNDLTLTKVEYEKDSKVKETVWKQNITETTTFNPEGSELTKNILIKNGEKTEEIKILFDGNNWTADFYQNNQRISQEQMLDGKNYTLNYKTVSGKGFDAVACITGVVGQCLETPEELAKKYNCDVAKLVAVNTSDKFIKINGIYYVKPGSSILIPQEEMTAKEFSEIQQGRKDAEGAMSDYYQRIAEYNSALLEKERNQGFVCYKGDLSFLGTFDNYEDLAREILRYESFNDDVVVDYIERLIENSRHRYDADKIRELLKKFEEQIENPLMNSDSEYCAIKGISVGDYTGATSLLNFLKNPKYKSILIEIARTDAFNYFGYSLVSDEDVKARATNLELQNVDLDKLNKAEFYVSPNFALTLMSLEAERKYSLAKQEYETSSDIIFSEDELLNRKNGYSVFEDIKAIYDDKWFASNSKELKSRLESYSDNDIYYMFLTNGEELIEIVLGEGINIDDFYQSIDDTVDYYGNIAMIKNLLNRLENYIKKQGVNIGEIKTPKYDDITEVKKYVQFLLGKNETKDLPIADVTPEEAILGFSSDYTDNVIKPTEQMLEKTKEDYCFITRIVQEVFADVNTGFYSLNRKVNLNKSTLNNMDNIVAQMAKAKSVEELESLMSEFKTLYKELTGIEFNQEDFARFIEAKNKLQDVMQAQAIFDTYNSLVYSVDNTRNYEDTLNVVLNTLKIPESELLISLAAIANTPDINSFQNLDDTTKRRALLTYINTVATAAKDILVTTRNGKSSYEIETDFNNSLNVILGTKGDLRVNAGEMVKSMANTEIILKVILELAIMVAMSFIPGGIVALESRIVALVAKYPKIKNLINTILNTAKGICKMQSSASFSTRMVTNAAYVAGSDFTAQLICEDEVDSERVLKSAAMGAFGVANHTMVSKILPKGSFVVTESLESFLSTSQAYVIESYFGEGNYGAVQCVEDFIFDLVAAKIGSEISSKLIKGQQESIPLKNEQGDVVGTIVSKRNNDGSVEMEIYDISAKTPHTKISIKQSVEGKREFTTTDMSRGSVTKGLLNEDGSIYEAACSHKDSNGSELALKLDCNGQKTIEIKPVDDATPKDAAIMKAEFEKQISSLNSLDEAIMLKYVLERTNASEDLIKQVDEKISEFNKVKGESSVENSLLEGASKENPASIAEDKIRKEWASSGLSESVEPMESPIKFENGKAVLDVESVNSSALNYKTKPVDEVTQLIFTGKLSETLVKRYEEMGKVFEEIGQKYNAEFNNLAEQYKNNPAKYAEEVIKILSKEFGMEGFEIPIQFIEGNGKTCYFDYTQGKILMDKNITDAKDFTTLLAHEFQHSLQFRDMAAHYGINGVIDVIMNDSSIPSNLRNKILNETLNNPYVKKILTEFKYEQVHNGSVSDYLNKIYKDEFTNTETTSPKYITDQVIEPEAYYSANGKFADNIDLNGKSLEKTYTEQEIADLRANGKIRETSTGTICRILEDGSIEVIGKNLPAGQPISNNSKIHDYLGIGLKASDESYACAYNKLTKRINKLEKKWFKSQKTKADIAMAKEAFAFIESELITPRNNKYMKVKCPEGGFYIEKNPNYRDPSYVSSKKDDYIPAEETTVVINSAYDFGLFSSFGAGFSKVGGALNIEDKSILPSSKDKEIVCLYDRTTKRSVIDIYVTEEDGGSRPGTTNFIFNGKLTQTDAEKLIKYLQDNIPTFLRSKNPKGSKGFCVNLGQMSLYFDEGARTPLRENSIVAQYIKKFFNEKKYLSDSLEAKVETPINPETVKNAEEMSNNVVPTIENFVPVQPSNEIILPKAPENVSSQKVVEPEVGLDSSESVLPKVESTIPTKTETNPVLNTESTKQPAVKDLSELSDLDLVDAYNNNPHDKKVQNEIVKRNLKGMFFRGKYVLYESLSNENIAELYNGRMWGEKIQAEALKRINNGTLKYRIHNGKMIIM